MHKSQKSLVLASPDRTQLNFAPAFRMLARGIGESHQKLIDKYSPLLIYDAVGHGRDGAQE